MNDDRDVRLDEVLAAYLEAQGHGWGPNRQRLLECYPHLADDLRQFFADEDRVERTAAALRPADVADSKATAEESPISLMAERPWPSLPGYEILEELGRGGFGVVYKARQVQANRIVALKMILSGRHADEAERRRFRGEIEAAARLRHPGVVQILEVGDHDGLPFFSMEFCAGGSLADHLDGTPLPPARAAKLVEALADAVQAAHDHKVIHRDLKPANVLLQEDLAQGRQGAKEDAKPNEDTSLAPWRLGAQLSSCIPKIADFGLARDLQTSGHTASGAIVGTPSYMAPEQAASQRHKVGPAVDVYALGAILYECLTGRPPFKGPTPVETVLQVLHDEAVPVRQLQPKTPRDLETICHKCLQKDPTRRYASARELADDLGRYARGEPVAARPVGPLERGWRWCRRHPAVAALLAVVMLALGTAAGLAGLVAWQQAENASQQAELSQKATSEADRARAEEAAAKEARHATQAQLERARSHLLSAQLARVDGLYRRDPFWALELLHDTNACPLDLRDAAWRFYERACSHWLPATLRGHTDIVRSTAFSPDGQTLASGSCDGMVKLWDVASGRERTSLKGHADAVFSVAFSPDGQTLASGGGDGTVRLWDVASSRERAALKGHTVAALSVAFSPDSKTLASGSYDRTVKLWDVASGRERVVLKGHTDAVHSVAFSPDGQTLASGSWDQTVKLWEVAGGQKQVTLKGHTNHVRSVAFSPDGKTLGSGGWDQTVKLWDVASGQERAVLTGHSSPVESVAFSPDGQTLASGSGDGMVRLWDVGTGKESLTLKGHTDQVWSVAFSPDGQTLASGSGDGMVKLWDVAVRPERATLQGHTFIVRSVAFSPDGKTLASASYDRTVKLWDVASGRERAALKGVDSMAFSPDGKTLATGSADQTVKLWDVASGQQQAVLKGHTGFVLSVAFSPDGQTLAGASGDRTVKLWDVTTRRERATLKGVDSMAFSPDGKTLATGSADQMVKLWDVTTGRERATLKGHTHAVWSVAFSPDGKTVASTSGDRTVKLWDVGGSRERAALKGHTGNILSVAFSPDGQTLATGSGDRTVKLWDVASGQQRAALKGHTHGVWSVAFSPDSKTLASGSWDRTVKLWDVASGQERATLKGHTHEVMSVPFSPDGKTLASGSYDRTVKLWDVAGSQQRAILQGHTNTVSSLAFSPDSMRLITRDKSDRTLVWDLHTGQRLDEAPPTDTAPGPVSPDGRLRADIDGSTVRLIDLTWTPPLLPPRPKPGTPDPEWHLDQAERAEKEKQWFAAGFHLGQLANHFPHRADLRLREATAWANAGQNERAALAFLATVLR